MAWCAFQEDKPFVIDALRQGHFDYVEVVGAVAETHFFRLLLGEGVLARLAAAYPTPRKKEEVPLWLYLASELTLRLHGASGFGAYPYVVHCGGLIDALTPERVEYKEEEGSGRWRTVVQGFNRKNVYARTTPCDKDFLRKLAKDTGPDALEHWFGTHVVREYQALGGFDAAGVFLIDGTWIFVPPDNDRYEGSSRLLFDEHGHPVSKEAEARLSEKQRRRCQWRRCYRAVTLSHTTPQKDYSLRCGTKVLPGKAAECPQVWPIVRRFVDAVGAGVMKLLIYDRGLVDGKTVGRLKRIGVDSLFPLKKGMDLWEDAKVLAKHDDLPWQHYAIPKPPPPPTSSHAAKPHGRTPSAPSVRTTALPPHRAPSRGSTTSGSPPAASGKPATPPSRSSSSATTTPTASNSTGPSPRPGSSPTPSRCGPPTGSARRSRKTTARRSASGI